MSRKARQFLATQWETHPVHPMHIAFMHSHAYAYILSHGLPAKLYLHSRSNGGRSKQTPRIGGSGSGARRQSLTFCYNSYVGRVSDHNPKTTTKDLTCEYHQGEVGHTVENCRVLRHRIQDLLDQGVLKFRIEGVINAIGVEKNDEVDITSTKIPWEPLFHELKKRGLLTVPRAPKESTEAGTCQYHPGAQDHNLQGCEEFKKEVATRMERIKEDFEEFCEKKKEELGKLTPATPPEMSKPDPVVIQYATKEKVMLQTASVSTVQSSEKVPSVVIQVPQPFPYHDNKRVPWNYGMKVISTREGKPKMEEEVVGNLTSGLGGITRSGRCYTPEELEKRRKEIGKSAEDPVKTKVAEDEAADFLRIIKSSEYSVVKQLSKMPSHISVLALLLASESHRKALLKVTNQLTFSDDELPPEGRGHIKALYISVKTNDRIVSRVLIDNGISSKQWQPLNQDCLEPGLWWLENLSRRGFQPGQGLGCANQGRTAIVTLEGNKDRYGLGYTPTRRGRQIAYEARRQRAAAKLRGEKWPEKKMVIPHIRTTFPASAMFQVDEGDVDELALLFAEDLNVNAITTEGDSTALPNPSRSIRGKSHLQRYRKKMALYMDNEIFNDLNTDTATTSRHPHRSNITTAAAEEEYAGPMVEGLSIHTITEEEDSTTPPTRHCQQGEEAKMWTCVPLLQRVSSSNEAKGGAHRTVKRVPRDLRLVLPRHARPRHRHSGPQDSAEARMQARETSTATNEARSHFEDQGRGGKAIEGRFPKHSNLFGLGSQYSPGPERRMEKLESTNAVFSFMDGFSGYNQIKMAEEDKSKTAFVTHWGTFVYDVMPFGLKNAGATYQRAMVTLFHDMIHHEIEVYVDDMIAKSRTAQDHLTDLRKAVPATEEVSAQIEPEQVFTATCEPLFKLLRKDVKIKWTEDCQRAFDKIKEYLLNPPILVPPTPGRPLILYLTVQETSMGCMLGQQDETGKKEQAIYYLSKKFTEPETRYLLVEKTCCALAWASKKLRQYMLYYTTWLVSRMDPIKYIFEKPALTGKIARWQNSQTKDVMTVDEDNHGRWKLYFDGAANAVGSGIGAVLVSPKGQQTPIAVKLGFDCTNNMTEYEACIVGLQAALEFGAYELEVFGDSLLIVSQTNGEWQARDPKLIPYQRYISRLVPKFKYITFTYTPRAHNHFADALATLASLIKLVEGDDVRPLRIETRDIPAYCVCRGSQSIDSRDARGIDGSPCQRTLPGPEDYESWLLLVDNGEGLHQTCPDVPQMPDASNGHEFILVAIDYFTKWVEACSFKNVTQVAVTRFVKNNIICRYGMPEMLITDNASNLNNRMMDQLCQQFKIQHHNSAPYRPKMNGAVEAANKNVKKILSKMTETYKDWHEHLPYALLLPVEVEIPSLRILSQTQLEEAEWAQARYEQLNFIDEKRLAALCHGQLYQRRIERAYNKKARPRTFQPGDLVLKKRNMALSDPRGKFAPSYEGPYVVKKAFSGGAIILADMDGEEFRSPIQF
uniref:Uncharacterized protein n=1 Tax=Fagus sylvatica TaxID=28930 RepID=A0A2N9IPC1_FAGSY